MKTLTAVLTVNEYANGCCIEIEYVLIQFAKVFLKTIETDSSVQFSRQFSSSPEQRQFRSHSSRTVTATATVKNQKTSHWFMCYKCIK
jgi:hypothetical protein